MHAGREQGGIRGDGELGGRRAGGEGDRAEQRGVGEAVDGGTAEGIGDVDSGGRVAAAGEGEFAGFAAGFIGGSDAGRDRDGRRADGGDVVDFDDREAAGAADAADGDGVITGGEIDGEGGVFAAGRKGEGAIGGEGRSQLGGGGGAEADGGAPIIIAGVGQGALSVGDDDLRIGQRSGKTEGGEGGAGGADEELAVAGAACDDDAGDHDIGPGADGTSA